MRAADSTRLRAKDHGLNQKKKRGGYASASAALARPVDQQKRTTYLLLECTNGQRAVRAASDSHYESDFFFLLLRYSREQTFIWRRGLASGKCPEPTAPFAAQVLGGRAAHVAPQQMGALPERAAVRAL